MILETIGLPGGGKTYLCDEIEKRLNNNNTDSVNILKYTSNIVIFKIIKKLFIFIANRTKLARDTRSAIKLILKQEDSESKFGIYNNEFYSINIICSFIILYRLLEKSNKVYVFDEGIVHTVIKMCADFTLSKQTFNSIMNIIEASLNNKNWYVIYNHIEIENCIESIKKRDRHICVFDELPENKLYLILQYYDKYNEFYCNTRKVLIVERNEPMNKKMEVIINKIYKMGVK